MRSSRISIRLINIGGASYEKVLARFAVALKAGDEVVILDVFQELLANASLDVSRGVDVLLFEGLKIRRNDDESNIALYCDARLVDPPFGDHAIAIMAALQYSGRLTVDIQIVAANNHAQLNDIEVSVFRFQWIERPFDQTDSALARSVALGELELSADPGIPVIFRDRKHVRMPIGHAIADAGHRVEKTRQSIPFKCAENKAADLVQNDHDAARQKIDVRPTESLTLEIETPLKFIELS